MRQPLISLAEPRGEIDRLSQQLAVLLGRNEPDPAWLKPAPVPSLGELRIDQAPADLLRTRFRLAAKRLGINRVQLELDVKGFRKPSPHGQLNLL